MALSNEERIQRLEDLLSKVESRRGGAGEAEEPASEPDVIDLSDDDDVIELTDDDEVTVEDDVELVVDDEEVPEIPEEFSTYEEAGEFWDEHDATDFLKDMTPVELEGELKTRHFEIEVDEDVVIALEKRALSEHLSAAELANDLLRKELVKD